MTAAFLWLTLLGLTVTACVVAWMKGTLGLIRDVNRELWRGRGEQWAWYVFFEPILVIPYTLASAALGLARPDSRWARWFYGDRRMQRARERYADSNEPQAQLG